MAVPNYIRPHNGADAKDVLTPVVGDGSVVFDKEENRNDVFSESVKPRNTITHVPYRGNEQHGVEFNTPAEDFTPYWSEQAAEDKYMSPEVSPRDVVPMKPIPVEIVDNPDLLRLKYARITNTFVPSVSTVQSVKVLESNRFRNRVRVYGRLQQGALPITTATFYVGTSQFSVPAGSLSVPGTLLVNLNSNQDIANFAGADALLDLEHTGELWVAIQVVTGTAAPDSGVSIDCVSEYQDYEGRPLL